MCVWGGICMCTYICLPVWQVVEAGGWHQDVLLYCSPPVFFFWDISLDLKFTISARLAGQWAPGILPIPAPQVLGYRNTLPCLAFYVGVGDLNLGPHAPNQKHFTPGYPLMSFLKSYPSRFLRQHLSLAAKPCRLRSLGPSVSIFSVLASQTSYHIQLLDSYWKSRSSYLHGKLFISWAFLISSSVLIDFFLMKDLVHVPLPSVSDMYHVSLPATLQHSDRLTFSYIKLFKSSSHIWKCLLW